MKLASLAFVFVVSALATAAESPKFTIKTSRNDDVVQVRVEKDRTMFAVKSPFGISQGSIARVDDRWPEVVVLRLHLKGLENFKASNGTVTLGVAAAVHEGKRQVRLWKAGKEDVTLDEKSPLWMDVRIVDGDGKPAKELPLNDGYFEMALPKAFFEGNPESIKLNWIDFYRN